jgi:hypothetical protein
VPEKKEGEQPIRNVAGAVKAVDVAKNTLTIANADGENTYPVAKDAEIWIDGKPAKLGALPPGPHVYATLTVERKTARHIDARGRHFPIVAVKAVDAAKHTITFDDDKAPPELAGKTFPVAKDPHIMIDGNPGQLAGVPPGSVISLYLCVDQKTVCTFDAGGPQFEGVHAVVVKAVDPAKNTITIDEDKSPPEVAGVTFPLAKNAFITVDSKPAKLAEIPPGALVNLTLSVDRKTARVIQAAGPGFQDGLVKAVDAAKNSITVAFPRDGEKTFPVARDSDVVIDFKPGKLAGIPAGAVVNLALCADQKTARRIEALGSSVSGMVQAVDAAKRTITVEGKTFPVAPDAQFVIDFKQGGKLTEVPAGAVVGPLILSVDQKTAIWMHAEGSRVSGVVQAVDTAKRTITIAGKTFPVAADADIEFDRKKSELAAIPRGAQVNPLILSVDQKTARVLYVLRP